MSWKPEPIPAREDVHAVACEVMKVKNTIPYQDAQRVATAAMVAALKRVEEAGAKR